LKDQFSFFIGKKNLPPIFFPVFCKSSWPEKLRSMSQDFANQNKRMMRSFVISLVFLGTAGLAAAQTFNNGLGVAFSIIQAKDLQAGHYKTGLIQSSVMYFPRWNLAERDQSSFSIGVPFSAGIGTVNNADGVFFNADIPVTGDYNMGCRSTPYSESAFGGYFGAGFGYNYTTYSGYPGSGNVSSYGPLVHAGIRVVVSKKFSEIMSFGIFYKYGLESEKYRTMGFNVLYEF
jgi:hypothetical protein